MSGRKRRKRGRSGPPPPEPTPDPPPLTPPTILERLTARRDRLRLALLDLAEAEDPGSARVLRERPALEAELWGLEAQVAAEQGDHQLARQYTQDAVRWQAEARKGIELDTAARVAALEARLAHTTDMGEAIRHLR